MVVTPGSIFNLLIHYWYATAPIVGALVFAVVAFIISRRRDKQERIKRKEVLAVILDGNIRSPILTVSADEIKDFHALRPRTIKGKRVYILQPAMTVISPIKVEKPSGNGEHEEKEAAATTKRKAK